MVDRRLLRSTIDQLPDPESRATVSRRVLEEIERELDELEQRRSAEKAKA